MPLHNTPGAPSRSSPAHGRPRLDTLHGAHMMATTQDTLGAPASVRRYHPALVILHWLLAIQLGLALSMGTFHLVSLPNASPEKLFALRAHLVSGGMIVLLLVVRLVLRLNTRHPQPVSVGHAVLDRLTPAMHWGLYALVLLMAGSGLALATQAGLLAIVFDGQGQLPASFEAFGLRTLHGFIAKLLMLSIGLHAVAAFYHQFVRRDGLLSRMALGKR